MVFIKTLAVIEHLDKICKVENLELLVEGLQEAGLEDGREEAGRDEEA